MAWTAIQVEALRLAQISWARRLTGARAAPINAPSEWIGWQIITPDANRRRYLRRLVDGTCTRCGGGPLASRTLCERCRERQRRASAANRAKRIGATASAAVGEAVGEAVEEAPD